MLQRKIANIIEEHLKRESARILLVDGARQVGKTFIIWHAGKRLFENLVELNLLEDSLGPAVFSMTRTV